MANGPGDLSTLKQRYGDAPEVIPVWGLPSEKIKCHPWGIYCILRQWVRIVVMVCQNLFDKAVRKATGKSRRNYIVKQGALSGKRVLFIRHGQGMHNVSMLGWYLVDPPLTSKGEKQAQQLHEEIKDDIKEVELVVVSPLMRAMQTAMGGFEGCNVAFHVTPLLRERNGAPHTRPPQTCDEGRTKAELLQSIPAVANWSGFAELPEVWWDTNCVETTFIDRVEELKQWVTQRPEKVIALVGHGGIFTRILGKHLKNCGHVWVDWASPASDDETQIV